MMKFAKNLATWAAHEGVKEVIILSGLDSGKIQRSENNVYVSFPYCLHSLLLMTNIWGVFIHFLERIWGGL